MSNKAQIEERAQNVMNYLMVFLCLEVRRNEPSLWESALRQMKPNLILFPKWGLKWLPGTLRGSLVEQESTGQVVKRLEG